MKHVLSIQDLSCVGRCSLTVALPVLSAMGCRCSVLPTAVLSTHTGFPNPEVIPLTDRMASLDAHWQALGLRFDAVVTGYMANPEQAEAVLPLLRRYKEQGSTIIVDPAMGDHGKLYSRLDEDHVFAMSEICKEADILVAAVGRANFVTADMVKEGAVVIDVGINRNADGKLCGDVDFEACKEKAAFITPVPGGVGPMTIATLMRNAVTAAKVQNGVK